MATVEQETPPLAAGMKMSRDEFLHLWEMHPEIKCAELIGGVVYMPSPVSIEHGDWESDLGTWLGLYRIGTPGTGSGHNTTTMLLKDAPQPDVNLRILPECGGISKVKGNYLAGAAELLAEVCRSSLAYDLHQKYELYEAAGIQEYVAVLVYEEELRWHRLVDGRYELMPPDADCIHRSRVFPGLWLDGQALLKRDMPKVLAVLQSGLASPEHQAFVQQLANKRTAK